MSCAVYLPDGVARDVGSLASISDILADNADAFVWLDVVDATADDFALIQEEFGLHPLAIEDAVKAHQRPKIEAYGDVWFVIVHAASRSGNVLELHEIAIFATSHFVVTVRARPPYALAAFRQRWEHLPTTARQDGGTMFYELLDVIVDGYLPIADAFEERVEELEAALLLEGARTREVLLEIYAMKRDLARFRRAVLPLRDILAPLMRGEVAFFRSDYLPYFRDVYDHVSIVVDQLDAARDLMNNARDTHVAIASNRQNDVARQLTIVATVFLPLTFITGFFGQNFGFLTSHINSPASFWFLGVGGEVVALAALLGYFRFKGWF
ncbi:MAG: magnesium transporter CorA family protein [Vulcanimicrobiaceae bacterium]